MAREAALSGVEAGDVLFGLLGGPDATWRPGRRVVVGAQPHLQLVHADQATDDRVAGEHQLRILVPVPGILRTQDRRPLEPASDGRDVINLVTPGRGTQMLVTTMAPRSILSRDGGVGEARVAARDVECTRPQSSFAKPVILASSSASPAPARARARRHLTCDPRHF